MDQKDKKEYEVGFLVREESKAREVVDAVKAAGGEVTLEGPVNRIRLAYQIDKQTEALFGFTQFMMDPAAAKALEKALTMNPDVLRFLILTPPPLKEKPRKPREAMPRPASKPYPSRAPEAPTLSNEALEKKIEEILQ